MKLLDGIRRGDGIPTVLLLLIGAGVLYGLGRWDKGIDEKVERWRTETEQVLDMGKAYRAKLAEAEVEKTRLQDERDTAQVEERRLRRLATQNARQDSIAREEAEKTPVADIAIRLRLQPLGPNEFIADSSTVRLLWATQLDYRSAASERDRLSLLVPNLTRQNTSLQKSLVFTEKQFATASARVVTLELQLEKGLEATQCKVLYLFKCPSRGVMYIAGAVTAVVAVKLTSGGL